jgi:hypothetical protein
VLKKRFFKTWLCKYVSYDLAMHIREAKVASCITVRESLVIHSHQVKHGSVQIMDRNGVLNSLKPKLIRCTVNRASLDSSASHPQGKTPVVMVTSLGRSGTILAHLHRRRSSEFAGTNDKRFIQQSTLLQIHNQRSQPLIALTGNRSMLGFDVAVTVPRL